MNTLNIQLSFCNARIKHSPQYSLEVAVIFCVNGTTVNPLLPPPRPPGGAYLFRTHLRAAYLRGRAYST